MYSHYSPNVPTLPHRLIHHLQSRAQSPTRSPSSLTCSTFLLSSAGPNLPFLKAPPSPHGFQVHLLPFSPNTPAFVHLLLGAFAAGRWHWTVMTPCGPVSSHLLRICHVPSTVSEQGHRRIYILVSFLKFCLRVSNACLDLKLLEGRSRILFCILQIFIVICQ